MNNGEHLPCRESVQSTAMIIVTGANGFIGSYMLVRLRECGREDVVAVDHFDDVPVRYPSIPVAERVDAGRLVQWLNERGNDVEAIIHLGACSDTTVTDRDYVMAANDQYTRELWAWSARQGKPLIYASSAATYGDGARGFDDEVAPSRYYPMNLYGESKQRFDLWALDQQDNGHPQPPRWAGVKYFNVYGPYEFHKERMASMAFHWFNQITTTGKARLFESYKPDVAHGDQVRDFIFVKDAVDATLHLLNTPAGDQAPNGLYNIGTGHERTFADLARAVFAALGKEPVLEFFPMPQDLRGQYQYFTRATVAKIRRAGFVRPFYTLEQGVKQYVEFMQSPAGIAAASTAEASMTKLVPSKGS